MKIDPTTGLPIAETDEEKAALTAYLAAATTQNNGQPGEIKTGKQLKAEAGGQPIDWEARYNGMSGALLQQRQGHEAKLGEIGAQLATLKADVTARDTQLGELRPKADGAVTLQQQLDAEKAEHGKTKALTDKQNVLLKFPGLLAQGADGAASPLLDILMAADLPLDQFEAKARLLAESTTFGKQQSATNGVGSQMPSPATTPGSAEDWRAKALAAHEKAKYAKPGTEKDAAQKEESDAWAKVKELSKK